MLILLVSCSFVKTISVLNLTNEWIDYVDRTMKLFAQRYTYLGNEICAPTFGIDAIASHDLQTPIRIPSVIMPPSLVPAPTPLVPHDSPSYPNGGYGQPYTPQGPYSAQAQGYTPQNYQQQGYAYGGGAGPGAGQNAPGGNFGTGGPGVAGPTGGVGVGAGGLGVNTNTAGILRPAPRVASPTTAPKRPLPDVDRMDGGAGSVTKKVRRSPPPGPHGPRRGMHQHPPGGGHSGPGSRRASPPPHSQSMPSMSHSGPGRGPAGGGMGMNPGGYGGPERRGRGRSPERANVPQSIIWMLSKLPTAAAYDG